MRQFLGAVSFAYIGVMVAVYTGMVDKDDVGQQVIAVILLIFTYLGITDRE